MFYKLVTSCLENCRRLELALTHRPLHNAIGATRETSPFFFESLNMHFFSECSQEFKIERVVGDFGALLFLFYLVAFFEKAPHHLNVSVL